VSQYLRFEVLCESADCDGSVAMVMLLRDFGPNGVIFMNVCVVISVAMVILLRDFGPNGIIFMTVCVYYFRFPIILDGQCTSKFLLACISVTSSLNQLTDWISN
jgi:uncharacterized YccA/Bax inhibitor family protein